VGDISQSLEAPKDALPDSLPSQIQFSLTWAAADLGDSEREWIMRLTHSKARDIEEAVTALIGSISHLASKMN
jgi:hypothetical protein